MTLWWWGLQDGPLSPQHFVNSLYSLITPKSPTKTFQVISPTNNILAQNAIRFPLKVEMRFFVCLQARTEWLEFIYTIILVPTRSHRWYVLYNESRSKLRNHRWCTWKIKMVVMAKINGDIAISPYGCNRHLCFYNNSWLCFSTKIASMKYNHAIDNLVNIIDMIN